MHKQLCIPMYRYSPTEEEIVEQPEVGPQYFCARKLVVVS